VPQEDGGTRSLALLKGFPKGSVITGVEK